MTKDYYLPSEIAGLVQSAGKSKSTFYRLVKRNKIHKRFHNNEEVYEAKDVDNFLAGNIQDNGRKKTAPHSRKEAALETDWITPNDLVRLYVFDVEAHGMDRAIEASIMHAWYQHNPFLTRILYKPSNRSQILGAMTILPLPEELIIRILRGEIRERNIAPNDILYYQSGKTYVAYIAFAAVDPRYKRHFSLLLHSFFDFWQKIPNLLVPKLYTVTTTPEWDELVGGHYFAPRYDLRHQLISNQPDKTDVYELDLRRPNFSPAVKEIQSAMKLLTTDTDTELIATIQTLAKAPDDTEAITFEKATREDLRACYDIDVELYGPGESNPVAVRETRYDKVPDGFYVLRHRGQIVAHTSFMPIDPSELKRLQAGIPGRIPQEKVYPFVVGKPLDIYFIIMSVKKDSDPQRRYGPRLLAGLTHVFRQLGVQGVNIQHIFAFSRTPDGIRLCEGLGMEKEPFANEPDRFMFKMNLQSGAPRIAREYQAGLAEYRANQRQKEFSWSDL